MKSGHSELLKSVTRFVFGRICLKSGHTEISNSVIRFVFGRILMKSGHSELSKSVTRFGRICIKSNFVGVRFSRRLPQIVRSSQTQIRAGPTRHHDSRRRCDQI